MRHKMRAWATRRARDIEEILNSECDERTVLRLFRVKKSASFVYFQFDLQDETHENYFASINLARVSCIALRVKYVFLHFRLDVR